MLTTLLLESSTGHVLRLGREYEPIYKEHEMY